MPPQVITSILTSIWNDDEFCKHKGAKKHRKTYPLCPPCPPFGNNRNFASGKSMSSYICREDDPNFLNCRRRKDLHANNYEKYQNKYLILTRST